MRCDLHAPDQGQGSMQRPRCHVIGARQTAPPALSDRKAHPACHSQHAHCTHSTVYVPRIANGRSGMCFQSVQWFCALTRAKDTPLSYTQIQTRRVTTPLDCYSPARDASGTGGEHLWSDCVPHHGVPGLGHTVCHSHDCTGVSVHRTGPVLGLIEACYPVYSHISRTPWSVPRTIGIRW